MSQTPDKTTLTPDTDDKILLNQVIDYYHATLKNTPKALAYLQKRGLQSPELIDHFKLGFADRTLGTRLPPKQVKAGKQIRSRLVDLGILAPSGHERYRGSLVVPVFDKTGVLTQLYGRKTGRGIRKETQLHTYLPVEGNGVFNLDSLVASKEAILTDSIINALTFWCAGFRNVIAFCPPGDPDPIIFKQHNIERLLIAFRRTPDGEQATQALADKLTDIETFRIVFPTDMDANDFALSNQPASEGLGHLIRKAEWLHGTPNHPQDLRQPKESIETPDALPSKDQTQSPSESPSDISELKSAKQDAKDEVVITLGDRRWRIRGLEKNLSFNVLKVNVMVLIEGDEANFFVDTLDLYIARARNSFIKQAAEELRLKETTIKRDLGRVLLACEDRQETQIKTALEPKEQKNQISEADRADAMDFLKSPDLLDQILVDFDECGVVGEKTNLLTAYLAATSRLLQAPLAIVFQSSSAGGKSSLMDAVLAFIPPEDQLKFSSLTRQSLYYMGEEALKNKLLAVDEEVGAEHTTYSLKLLQSEKALSIASTSKDTNGRLVTERYSVKGPTSIFFTTTAAEIDEELQNRTVVLTADESREQTRNIHRLQRQRDTLDGLLAIRVRDQIINKHQNAQRLLKPIVVINPFAEQLTFRDDLTRCRRDNAKYLGLIKAVTLLHQHQRTVKHVEHHGESVPYIECTPKDVAIANKLAHQILGCSLDQLAPQTRRLLNMLDEMVTEACERLAVDRSDFKFTRRQVREHTGWSYKQVRIHLQRLVDLEYVLIHSGGRGRQIVYELLYSGEGQSGHPFLMGLIDVDKLCPTLPPHCPAIAQGVTGDKTGQKSNDDEALNSNLAQNSKTTKGPPKKTASSYSDDHRTEGMR